MRSDNAISPAAGSSTGETSTLPGRCVKMSGAVAVVMFLVTAAAPVHAQAGQCCWANGSPGCDDADCEMQICAFDPFCCDVEWDRICGCAALDQCAYCGDLSGGCGPGPDSCCEPKDKPGCEHPDCEALICASDPFCCEVAWDMLCAGAANNQCEVCGGKPLDPDDPSQCDGDLTGDGTVGPMDLLELADSWGPCSGDCPADLDGDGFVNTEDILILLQNWGECPGDVRSTG